MKKIMAEKLKRHGYRNSGIKPRLDKKETLKRVNIMLPETMYNEIVRKRKQKLSGTIVLEDALSDETVTLSVSTETKALYHEIFNKRQCTDKDIEVIHNEIVDIYSSFYKKDSAI